MSRMATDLRAPFYQRDLSRFVTRQIDIALLMIPFVIIFVFIMTLDRPQMVKNHLSGECMKVLTKDGAKPCGAFGAEELSHMEVVWGDSTAGHAP